MKTQANRIGINIMAFAVIVLATLAGCACESSSRPAQNTAIVTPAVEVSVPNSGVNTQQLLTKSFRAQADAAALATRNEVNFDLAVRIHTKEKMMTAANAWQAPSNKQGELF
jgi:hypothetical protein